MGVARCSVGRGGLEGAAIGWLPTGLALGDGGIARPSLGVRAPPFLAPGMAGRRRGTGEGPELCVGREIGVGAADCCYGFVSK